MTEGLNPKQEQIAIKVEVATEKDWEAYKNLRIQAISSKDAGMFGPRQVEEDRTKDEEGWKKDLSRDDRFVILAREVEEAIGMCMVKKKQDEAWDIGSGYIKEDSRGKVFARKAIVTILDEIKKRGGVKALIITKEGNQDMITLAGLLGFKKSKIEDGWCYLEFPLKDKK